MSRSLSILSALAVMASGIIVVFGSTTGSETTPGDPVAVGVRESAPPTTGASLVPISPQIPGVPPAVSSVLLNEGSAERLGPEQLTELDPAVTRVLIAHGATLRVPLNADGAQGR